MVTEGLKDSKKHGAFRGDLVVIPGISYGFTLWLFNIAMENHHF